MAQARTDTNRYAPVARTPLNRTLDRLIDALTRGRGGGTKVLVLVNTTRGQVAVPVRRRDLPR